MSNKSKLHIENRISHLAQKPVENANLIKKWQRKLRAANK